MHLFAGTTLFVSCRLEGGKGEHRDCCLQEKDGILFREDNAGNAAKTTIILIEEEIPNPIADGNGKRPDIV